MESASPHVASLESSARQRRLFLLYHEVRPAPSAYSYVIATAAFAEHARLFRRLRETLGRSETLLPEITFDDGHLSNLTEAAPVLQASGLTARFFITAGWTGTRAGYLSADELRQLHAAGQAIGAHGYTHALLTHCTANELDRELRGARFALEDMLGAPVTTMSLPGGRYDVQVLMACAEAGYQQVYSSIPRAEPAQLPSLVGRLNIRGDAKAAWLERLLDPATGELRRLERLDRLKSTAKRLLGDTAYRRLWALVNREEPDAAEDGAAGR